MPIWAFHNDLDSQLPVSLTYEWINEITILLQTGDIEPVITIYEEGEGINDHDPWTRAYHDQVLFYWLFNQRKK
jgi:predicted peptidase